MEKHNAGQGAEVSGVLQTFMWGIGETSEVCLKAGEIPRMGCAVPFPQEKSSPGRERSKYKGPKEGACLECSRNSEGPVWLEQRK